MPDVEETIRDKARELLRALQLTPTTGRVYLLTIFADDVAATRLWASLDSTGCTTKQTIEDERK